jgi:hypothetical protein
MTLETIEVTSQVMCLQYVSNQKLKRFFVSIGCSQFLQVRLACVIGLLRQLGESLLDVVRRERFCMKMDVEGDYILGSGCYQCSSHGCSMD